MLKSRKKVSCKRLQNLSGYNDVMAFEIIGPLWGESMLWLHYNDVIMGAMVFQITSLTIVYATVYSGTDQRKHQSSVSRTFVGGIHRSPVNSPHKGPVTRKLFPFDDVIIFHHAYRVLVPAEQSNQDTCPLPPQLFQPAPSSLSNERSRRPAMILYFQLHAYHSPTLG